MKYLKFLPSIYVLWIAVSLLGSTGCDRFLPLDSPPPEEAYPKYQCTTPVHIAQPENRDVNITVTSQTGACATWNYPLTPQTGDGLTTNVEAYCDKNWTVKEIGLDKIKGAGWIQTAYNDRIPNSDGSNNTINYLSLDIDANLVKNIEGIYIAYDSKGPKKDLPTWLKDYQEEPNPDTGEQAFIRVDNPNAASNISTLYIWRYNKPIDKNNNRISIPSNLFGTSLPQGIQSQKAMYLVIVNPEKDYRPGPVQVDSYDYDNCTDDKYSCKIDSELAECEKKIQDLVKQNAKDDCKQRLKDEGLDVTRVCGEPVCTPPDELKDCPSTSSLKQSGLSVQPYSFLRSSEIEFDPSKYPSRIDISIQGIQQQYNTDVSGTLHFEYNLDPQMALNEIRLNSLVLKAKSLNTKAGTFSDIIISSVGRVTASCDKAKSIPSSYMPCDWYKIPPKVMAISVAADHENGSMFMLSKNLQPIEIQIDHKTRTFDLVGGPILGPIKVNGEDKQVSIFVNVRGHFLNFAPLASAVESQKWAECVEGHNATKIRLNASASKEIYGDALPTNKDSYLWYEDLGLVTEKLWGKGQNYEIPPGLLTYGVHNMTLLLYDEHGISDTDSFKVEVRDTQAPVFLSIPNDRYAILPITSVPIHQYIGQASASDTCSDNVMITNDGPIDGMYSEGITPITWTADDGHGNLVSNINNPQNIVIITYKHSVNDMLRVIKEGGLKLKSALSKSATNITECEDIFNCRTNLASLLSMAQQLVKVAEEMPVSQGQEKLQRELLERLDVAGSSLEQANELIKRKPQGERERMGIHSRVIDQLSIATEIMGEISKSPWPSDPDDINRPIR